MSYKKNSIICGGNPYILEEREVNVDKFLMVHYFILGEQQKEQEKQKEAKTQDIYSKTDAFHMFGVSSTGYYNWVFRYEDRDGKRKEKKLTLETYQEKFKEIIKKLGFVPGKKTFRTHMWRTYGIDISVKKAKKIMNSMGLIANKPKKDAYKGQATLINQIGILTLLRIILRS